MNKTIRHSFFYPHPHEVVWTYLTESKLLAKWLMENNFKAEVGHHFYFKTKPKFKLNFDGHIDCEVLKVVKYRLLSYSWKGGGNTENPKLDSVVTWTLQNKNHGTVLTLEHRGFEGLKNYPAYFIMNMGWIKIGKRFLANLNQNDRANA
ncbi:SRPBCC domain-containing protein [Echinicola sp. CAU 1574]|uniref:SRPBCC domain-containing protein n=1 Tax=Echinicola arenosa TaxID=2774144 RepID=A0ABR9AS32_9BACT|nr:SRPBCC domain-containing protein [Echinicola arenosa]MBD8490683.1 SRPBCC domain-containing protein [Echinicola arenosa]